MNLMKKVGAILLAVVMLVTATSAMTVSADWMEEGKVEGARWFPVPVEKQNDEAWEVECVAEGCLCQRFTETAEDTGNTNFLDTVYTENGGLTLTRNGADGQEYYWPRIRTVYLETAPELDIQTANTLYYNIDVAEGTQWNINLSINGMIVSLARMMAEDCGATLPEGPDAPAGHFEGALNIPEAINEIASDPNSLDYVNAQALKNMKKTFLPQIQVYVVGGVGTSLTLNELYISSAEDTTGENCTFVDMGVLTGFGDEWYEMKEEEENEAGDQPAADPEDTPVDDPMDTPAVDSEGEDDSKDNTTPTTASKKDDKDSGSGLGVVAIIIIVVVLVVVVVAAIAVVAIIVLKKKKA